MEWKNLSARSTSERLEILEDLFWRTGAVSVTILDAEDKSIFEPGPGQTPLWEMVTATGLYEDTINVEEIRLAMKTEGFELYYVESLGDRLWEQEWLTRFKPMQFGRRLWVCPTGYRVDETGAIVMDLDPGLAFGTGTHATTRLCLEWLDGNITAGMKVVDYGTGSGILGIGALLLGAGSVVAVDNDPQALIATQQNAVRNHVSDRLHSTLADEFEPGSYDVVIANILAQPLIDLSGSLMELMKPDADLVLSGIMASQADWVKRAYPLRFISEVELDSWVCIHARTE